MLVCRRLGTLLNSTVFLKTASVFHHIRDIQIVQSPPRKFIYLAKFCTMAAAPTPVKYDYGSFSVVLVPALEDNYMYVVIDKETNLAAAIDPVEPDKVLDVVKRNNAKLECIWTTHHHWDHAGGNQKLSDKVKDIAVYGGGENVEAVTRILKDNEKFKLGSKTHVTAFSTPCHTKTHICYHVYDEDKKADVVFTGDTLFMAGAGKFFEGNGQQMHNNLNTKLAALDENCKVFCGHEYTVSNLKFAAACESTNAYIADKLKWAEDKRGKLEPTIPSTIGEEKLINPFMRIMMPPYEDLFKQCGGDLNKTMDAIREKKNNFK